MMPLFTPKPRAKKRALAEIDLGDCTFSMSGTYQPIERDVGIDSSYFTADEVWITDDPYESDLQDFLSKATISTLEELAADQIMRSKHDYPEA